MAADCFRRRSCTCFRPRSRSPYLLPSMLTAIFAASSGFFWPRFAADILARDSSVNVLPFWAADMFLRDSAVCFLPTFDAASCALCFWATGLIFMIADFLALVSAECLYPKQLPAVGHLLYVSLGLPAW